MLEQSVGHRQLCAKVIRPHLRTCKPPVGIAFHPPTSGCEIETRMPVYPWVHPFSGPSPRWLYPVLSHASQSPFYQAHSSWLGAVKSRPVFQAGESCERPLILALPDFFGYREGAALKLFSGTLNLRYSSFPFSQAFPLGQSSVQVVPKGWYQPSFAGSPSGS